IIKVNADENRVWRAVFNIDARVEWNKNIVRSRHHHVELGFSQFLAEPRGDIESDSFFRRTVSTVGAAVAPAVAGIDDDGGEGAAGVLYLLLRWRNRSAASKKKRADRDYDSPIPAPRCD